MWRHILNTPPPPRHTSSQNVWPPPPGAWRHLWTAPCLLYNFKEIVKIQIIKGNQEYTIGTKHHHVKFDEILSQPKRPTRTEICVRYNSKEAMGVIALWGSRKHLL